jgi:glutamine---fructose-6-phosphate transaminase (isomerizing)
MTANSAGIKGAYLQDILDQPRAIRDTTIALADSPQLAEFAKQVSSGNYRQIVLTGMGGSFHALNPLYLRLVQLGVPAVMAETSELIYFMPQLLNRRTLMLVVSQSGRSAEIIKLLDRNGERPTILSVTNDPTSPLAEKSDIVALIQAGAEASVSCKTTTASLAALMLIGECVAGRNGDSGKNQLEVAAQFVENYLAQWRTHVESIMQGLSGIRHLFITGRGSSLVATGVGGMMMKEAAHFHAEGMGSAAFRHGPFEMLDRDCCVVVLAGDANIVPLHQRLVKDVRDTGAKAQLVGTAAESEEFRLPDLNSEARPIAEMIPLQMVSLALAAMGGREPGKFERIGKVTSSE